MKRRTFIRTTGFSLASLIVSPSVASFNNNHHKDVILFPEQVSAIINEQPVQLTTKDKNKWIYQDVSVLLTQTGNSLSVHITAPDVKLSAVALQWKTPLAASSLILNDQWERTYGDVSWHRPTEPQRLPWYFMEYNEGNTHGFGVKVGAASFCCWQIDKEKLSLMLDTRCGGSGVALAHRTLPAAEIVTIKNTPGETAFETTRRFTKLMCPQARMPKQPVYGINDWYFSYGKNSESLILQHTDLMAPMADGLANRPFSLIDAGWFKGPPSSPDDCCWGDRMDEPNRRFSDMAGLAQKIRKRGMRPGIWTWPLCGSYKESKSLMLPLVKGREENKPVLDPSIPENGEKIKNYFRLYNQWGYEIVKFDFTSFDIFGRWGFDMIKEGALTAPGWSMYDHAKTNAEIVLHLYKSIRAAAGETYLIGCNTFSHLSAGLFELNRIGDDTSGNEWKRTRTMGVNTLAFRGVQHGNFYAADPDCVGLTGKVPWDKNRQWMELVAKSGTPLFISAQPEATGAAQKKVIRECFRLASQNVPLGEPLDWMENPFPQQWNLNGETVKFNWD